MSRNRNSNRKNRTFHIESLERREMMSAAPWQTAAAATIVAADPTPGVTINQQGRVFVQGGSNADNVSVNQVGNNVVVNFNGSQKLFAAASVTSILFKGGRGDDSFTNNTSIAANADGELGNDKLIGGRGNDVLRGWDGNDWLDGREGNDELHGAGGNDTLLGGIGDDRLYGGDATDHIDGGAGNDRLEGGLGNDGMYGGDGNDFLFGQEGGDWLYGGLGNDELYGELDADELHGDGGDDKLFGGVGDDTLIARDGISGNDVIDGGAGRNTIVDDIAADPVPEASVNDRRQLVIQGGSASDIVAVSFVNGMIVVDFNGRQEKFTSSSVNTIVFRGGAGDDTFTNNTSLAAEAYGDAGNDTLNGGSGNDVLLGGDGNDLLSGNAGNDRLEGNAGNDKLYGGVGDDTLIAKDGISGNDIIDGGAGRNTIVDDVATDPVPEAFVNDRRQLVIQSGSASDIVTVRFVNGMIVVDFNGRLKSFASSSVNTIVFRGGLGNDTFTNNTSLAAEAYGDAGNDTLNGGSGNDVLLGGDGNDCLFGNLGNDRLNGQTGADEMRGGAGDDVIISIDAAFSELVEGGAGADIIWADRSGSNRDSVIGNTTGDILQEVSSFANGADRTLNGDRITDPTPIAGTTYRTFSGNPLFATDGPTMSDVRQGAIGDCYWLAGLSAVARDNPHALRQNVVDFNDGTYGVRLGNSFYRVDNDLPVANAFSTRPANAALGAENSMWVAVVEKAFAHYRTGANSYASLNGGWGVEVNLAFRSASPGTRWFSSYSSAAAMAAEIANLVAARQAVTIEFFDNIIGGAPIVVNHAYAVASVARNAAGAVASITLRNPWGVDGGGNLDSNPTDGLVILTPGQIFAQYGRFNWGRV